MFKIFGSNQAQLQGKQLIAKKLFSSSTYDLAIIGGGPGGKTYLLIIT